MNEFEKLVYKMRKHQREFFASRPGTLERQTALIESKKCEKQVDSYLSKFQQELELTP